MRVQQPRCQGPGAREGHWRWRFARMSSRKSRERRREAEKENLLLRCARTGMEEEEDADRAGRKDGVVVRRMGEGIISMGRV